MAIVKFPRELLVDELDLPFEAIEERVIDVGRWHIYYEIFFEYDGKFYRTNFRVGATEYQDEGPWEYQNEIECVEVEKRLVQREEWVPVG